MSNQSFPENLTWQSGEPELTAEKSHLKMVWPLGEEGKDGFSVVVFTVKMGACVVDVVEGREVVRLRKNDCRLVGLLVGRRVVV